MAKTSVVPTYLGSGISAKYLFFNEVPKTTVFETVFW